MTRCDHEITLTLRRGDLEELKGALSTAEFEAAIPDDLADAIRQELQDALDAHDSHIPHPPVRCLICGVEGGGHDWETHTAKARSRSEP